MKTAICLMTVVATLGIHLDDLIADKKGLPITEAQIVRINAEVKETLPPRRSRLTATRKGRYQLVRNRAMGPRPLPPFYAGGIIEATTGTRAVADADATERALDELASQVEESAEDIADYCREQDQWIDELERRLDALSTRVRELEAK